jgi:hypothetical protein
MLTAWFYNRFCGMDQRIMPMMIGIIGLGVTRG